MTAIQAALRDLAYGWRSLVRAPGFLFVVVLTLGLGIGTNVTMFSVVYSVLWRPLPYSGADRMVMLGTNVRRAAGQGLSPAETVDLRRNSRTLALVAGVSGVDANLTIDGELERVYAVSASDDALAAFGVMPPALGRGLRAQDDLGPDGFVRAVVISDALWRRRLSGDRAAIGKHILVNNIDVEIVGILRPGFRVFLPAASNAAEDVDIWFPRPDDPNDRRFRDPATLARLAPGVTLAEARAELGTLAASVAAAHPSTYPSAASSPDYDGAAFAFTIEPLQDVLTARVRPALLALGAAVAFVLLIACVNVTNLMLARASERTRELAVRRALGAGRGRLVGQLFFESLILAALGGTVGLLASLWGVDVLEWLRPTHLPRQSQIAVDTPVAVYAALVSSAACLVFGILPALRVTGRDETDALRQGRTGTAPPRVRRLQRALVIGEVALSIVPLVAGGLMIRTVWNLSHAPIGFEPSGVVTARVAFSFRAFADFDRRWALNREAVDRVRRFPGVEAVSAASPLPFAPLQTVRSCFRAGDDGPRVPASSQVVLPGYLDVMRIRLIDGRDLSDDDNRSRRMVAIVDRHLASRLWPAGGAVGQKLGVQAGQKTIEFEVIGVSESVRAVQVRDADIAHVFLPFHYSPGELSLVIRTTRGAASLAPSLRSAVESLGTQRPVVDIRPMTDYTAASIGESRFTMLVLAAFAGASLLLAGVGLYGTLAYLIARRTAEFGLRVALGASMTSVIALVVREAAWLVSAGALAGLAGALALAGTIRGLLYGVEPLDPGTVAAVTAAIAVVTLAATAIPAWRAAGIDPVKALRDE